MNTESNEIKDSKKSNRGGARPGAGRKPKLEISERARAKLTVRQQRVITEKLGGKHASDQAVLVAAGYSEETARSHAAAVLQHPLVQSEFQRLIDKAIPHDRLVARLSEGLDAEETVFAKFEGKITDKTNVVAWSERRAYAELVCRLTGKLAKEEQPTDHPDIRVNIIHIGGGD